MNAPAPRAWSQAAAVYLDRRAVTMLLLGFSAGMPILLIFSSLSLWLREAGVERSTVTMFSWAALAYSFKFIWAPLIDALPVPLLSRLLGRRRGWLLVAQVLIICGMVAMSMVDPQTPGQLAYMAAAAVLLGFSSATQDVVIDAYRIELAPEDAAMQAVMSSTYLAGYRMAMVVAGAGALYLADILGSTKEHYVYAAWQTTYLIMAAVMLVGVATTLCVREPAVGQRRELSVPANEYLRLVLVFVLSVAVFVAVFAAAARVMFQDLGPLLGFVQEAVRLVLALGGAGLTGWLLVRLGAVSRETAYRTWVEPIVDFFTRYGRSALWVLALIGLYRISDVVAGVISNVFYEDLGFTKIEIANAVKTMGVLMVIVGGFLGGLLAQRMPLVKLLALGAVLASLTNFLFVLLAWRGNDALFLYLAVMIDNLAVGIAGSAFIAFMSALTNIRFTAVQFAIFSSLMTLLPKTLGGYSGAMVDNIGYPAFFTFTALIGLPVLWLVYQVGKRMDSLGKPPAAE